MEVHILAFGRIADLTASREWKMKEVRTTGELRQKLEVAYPALREISYVIAVDQKIISTDASLGNGAEVALLPPFSGG